MEEQKKEAFKSVSPTCLVRDLQGLLSARENETKEEKEGKEEKRVWVGSVR